MADQNLTAPTATSPIVTAISQARETLVAALAGEMKAAALAAIEQADFSKLAAEALENASENALDFDAIAEAAGEILNAHEWEMTV